jgi:DNA polymerase-3 subunit alpha
MAGIVMSKQERTARSGNRFAFVQFSDTEGSFEVTVFADLLSSSREILEAGEMILMDVDAQGGKNGEGDDLRFIGRSFERLADVAARMAKGVRIKLYDPSLIEAVKEKLSMASKGRGKIVITLDLDDELAEMELPGGWLLTEELKNALRGLGAGIEVQEW